MAHVTVLVLHPDAAAAAGPLRSCLAEIRRGLAETHRTGFIAAGADDVRIVAGPPDDTPFGARLRGLASGLAGGLVVLGSGSLPLATRADRAAFLRVAAFGGPRALANSRYSADAVAVGVADVLARLPDLDADNALPRWLAERGGFEVADLAARWRLGVDLDGPLDVLLASLDARWPASLRPASAALSERSARSVAAMDAVREALADRRAEVLVAGRTGSASLRWLERSTAARIRALVEERGLRASSPLALGPPEAHPARSRGARPPVSTLGMLLDLEGPEAFGEIVGRLADAAVVDSRVLLAHHFGVDPARWPSDEDRFASDLLRPDLVVDPWLRALTESAAGSRVPVVLGGHTVVGPGIRLLAGGPRR
jgi:hypothetical protein